MSRRETRLQPISLRTVAGVNQRVRATELPLHQYPTLEGVFPEFAGLQSRIWGKRLLQKYDDAIYGIHQFWTPQGYGGGLYQFDGTLDFGQWLTPNSSFDLTIPPIGWDGGNMTLDEFGLPYGSNFGYGTDNTCLISFLNGSTDHSACLPPPTPADTPNDHNGGPGGQGTACKWVFGDPVDMVIAAPVNPFYGTWAAVPVETIEGPVPLPTEPTIPAQEPDVYAPGTGPFGAIWFASAESRAQKINLGGGNWKVTQTATAGNTTGELNLTAFLDPDNLPAMTEILIRHNGNAPFDRFWKPFDIGPGPYNAIPINTYDYIIPNYQHVDGGVGGYVNSDFIVIERIRFTYNGRHCE